MSKHNKKNILHPDVTYLLDPRVTDVIGQGLATLCEERPNNPVDYLAKWLLKHSYSENERAQVI
ncbi:MAG: hypothetical protein P4L67_02190 [Candidatus Pacebacteria bacterium]|nr:hypothetical protein [Candidatus Paceibacterota bacterium]